MLDFLYSLGLVVFIMIVWFKTDAFPEYCKLFNFNFLLFGYDKTDDQLTFPQYLYVKRHILTKCKYYLFYIKLITCPICLSFWLCLGAALIYNIILLVPLLYVTSLLVYLIFTKLLDH
jgi:hypothetical protein